MSLNPYTDALRIISENIPDSVNWVVTGSTALAFQGIPVEPNDIDIQANADEVYEIEKHLQEYSTVPVEYLESENIKSHFGKMEINGILVELMGSIQKRLPNGEWEEPTDLEPLINWISYNNLLVPVLDLKYEYKAYKILGRDERAELIKQYID